MTRYRLYRKLGGPRDRYGRVQKIRHYRDSNPGPSIPSESLYQIVVVVVVVVVVVGGVVVGGGGVVRIITMTVVTTTNR